MPTRQYNDSFRFTGAAVPPAVGSITNGPWCSKKVGSCSVAQANGGWMTLALDPTSEVQNACLYQGDVLSYPIAKLIIVEFLVKASAGLAAAVSGFFGVGSARNDDPGAVAQFAGFRLKGSNDVVAETDDNVTDINDVATGLTLDTTPKRFQIAFAQDVTPVSNGQSRGGLASVAFLGTDGGGRLRRVAQNQIFDMKAATSDMQVILQLQKTTGTATGSLSVKLVDVAYVDDF